MFLLFDQWKVNSLNSNAGLVILWSDIIKTMIIKYDLFW